jgi:hypothetical protein
VCTIEGGGDRGLIVDDRRGFQDQHW